jgi:hypothetical protein
MIWSRAVTEPVGMNRLFSEETEEEDAQEKGGRSKENLKDAGERS